MVAEATRNDLWRDRLAREIRGNSRLFFKLAYEVLRDRDAAEDALQHAMCQAWEQRERITEPSALTAWLSRTVVNRCLMVLRRKAIERKALSAKIDQDEAAARPVNDPIALRESVLAALEELPEMTRAVIVLRLMRGVTGNETAAMLGVSPSEVSRRLHGGMDQLRHHLADWQDSVGA